MEYVTIQNGLRVKLFEVFRVAGVPSRIRRINHLVCEPAIRC